MSELLSVKSVVERLWPSDERPKDEIAAVRRLVRIGMMVGGERVKLAAVRRPSGMAFRSDDVEAFERAIDGASAGTGAQRVKAAATKTKQAKATRPPTQTISTGEPPIRLTGTTRWGVPTFARCGDDEVGTYPTRTNRPVGVRGRSAGAIALPG